MANWFGRRVRTPTLLQMEAVECGAAALGIVLHHHGRHPPLEELRVECGVSRDGSKASDILRAARRYGCEAKGMRLEPAAALALPFPFIAHWNFNHFLVVEGVRGGKVFLNDPATGPTRVTLEAFDAAFTGIALTVEPGPEFRRDARPAGTLRQFVPLLRQAGSAVPLSVLISLLLIVPGLLIPAFTKIFVDDVLIHEKTDWLRPLIAIMIVTALVYGALSWLQQLVLLRAQTALAVGGSARFLWHLLRLPVEFFTQRHTGDVANRVAANDRLAGIAANQLGASAVNAVTALFYALVMLSLDAPLALACIALGTTNLAVWKLLARRREDAGRRLAQDLGRFESATVTGILAIETLKATATDDDYFARWSGLQANHNANQRQLGGYGLATGAVEPLIGGLTTAAILGLGGLRVVEGDMTIGTLVAFQMLVQSFMGPLSALVAVFGTLVEAKADLARVGDVMRHPQARPFAEPVSESGAEPRRLEGRVTLEGVGFGYQRHAPPLIKDFNLEVAPGARVALVGGSGSGKSTVAKLIAGLHRPWSGVIRFDGVPMEELPRSTLIASVGVVGQEIHILSGSVRENLSMWDPTLPDRALADALADADVMEVVTARPRGLSGLIDEGGANFSGGQAQRLAIARALARDPSILILDEAMSALDPLTEQRIDEAIRRRGCTCIVVAHRLSTVRDADEILVLDRGRVVERGNHDALIARDGAYRCLMVAE
ncbi:NHLP family bacteriocin export ABC transporter peptidase/permease/ATPase subunit [Azospirillum agricola]|uniref:NHLP family bacteriocin export ABC transporter peptidase/permease/ATPase subunit n=1 Tax=Azospirillum agricola TaxID=1720247 RepID=UPI000A0F3B23|nr:NHLP family bacteriocin export ABC transporter peptidase/permease/ATPase subunit [Azospirillum agricola]SMH28701.1 NHLM bacteriocin system ABC transporter, peptidase/ATP-binding protein [Azospirillum lipoferum]